MGKNRDHLCFHEAQPFWENESPLKLCKLLKQGQKSIPGRGKEQVLYSLVEDKMVGTGNGRRTSMAGTRKARGDVVHSEAKAPKDDNYVCP